MSLINNMLKGLEARKGDDSTSAGQVDPFALRSHRSRKPFWILLIILLIVLAAVLWLRYQQAHPHPQAIKSEPIKVEAQPKNINLTSLQAVRLDTQGDTASWFFTFNQPITYHMQMDKAHRTLSLQFDGATWQQQTLERTPLISNFDLKQDGNNLVATFAMVDRVHMVHAGFADKEKQQFVIQFEKVRPVEKTPTPEQIKAVSALTEKAQWQKQFQKALDLVAHDQLQSAVTILESLVAKAPNMHEARLALVTVLLKMHQADKALQYIQAGLAITPDSIPLITMKARVQMQQNDLAAAQSTLSSVSPPVKAAPDFYSLYALLEQRMGHYPLAISLYKQLIAIDPNNSRYWLGMAICLDRDNQPNAALEAYQRTQTLGGVQPVVQAFVMSRIKALGG